MRSGKKTINKTWVLLAVALCAGGFFFFRGSPQPLEAFEVGNFSGGVEIYSAAGEAWGVPVRGTKLGVEDKIRTGPDGELDLVIPDKFKVRVKGDSELEGQGAKPFEKQTPYRFNLIRGQLMVNADRAAGSDDVFEVRAPGLVATSSTSAFNVHADPKAGSSWVGVLRGKVYLKGDSLLPGKGLEVSALEKAQLNDGKFPAEPVALSREEWSQVKEIYDLSRLSAAQEAMQLDLAKEAGSFFDNVFDHGTFYTPKIGFSNREFEKDESTGKVILNLEYDVFPRGSYVGAYFKTRNFDVSKYSELRFEMRRAPGQGHPESFRIELKSTSGIVRAFAAKLPKNQWEVRSFPLLVRNTMMVNEVTFVFYHDRVGSDKKGAVQLRDVQLIPAEQAAT